MSAAKSDRLWMAGGTAAGVAISALAWFMVVSPELSNAASLDEQTAASQTQNVSLQSKIHRLQADNSNMDALVTSLREARTALPVTSSLAEFTRQLSGYAIQDGVSISAITAGDPVSVVKAAPAAAAAASGSAPAVGSTSTGSAASSRSGTLGGLGASPAGQTYALPLTVVVKGAAASNLRFLAEVQGPDKRAALVLGSQLTGDASKQAGVMQLTIQLQLFVAPQAPSAVDDLLQRLAGSAK